MITGSLFTPVPLHWWKSKMIFASFRRASFIVIAQVSLLSRFRKKRYKSWAKLAWDCQWGAIIRILWSLRRVGGVRYIWLWLKQNPSFFQPFPTGRLAWTGPLNWKILVKIRKIRFSRNMWGEWHFWGGIYLGPVPT